MQVEVPFVPASQREPRILDKRVEDTIVVVGKFGGKKRRRDAPSKDMSEQSARGSVTTEPKGREIRAKRKCRRKDGPETRHLTTDSIIIRDQKDFDFSAVPNILDDPSNPAEEPSRPKKVKGSVSSRGNFSAAQEAQGVPRGEPFSRVDLVCISVKTPSIELHASSSLR
ncbi:hypothetical protein M378DRAFT_813274 [Amanita muscaria Koide BX008]|uniref:Uncharacterized protein n=1 Tax=Amanita muscaria (strain Koide BX008) TaxID=946122 RepID=A0A0C2WYH1_AMAMK|nr:hypothetical protein M378DRAFT_813274 [Amanita muscaria Koide BX008]